ncbi:MAG TPA: hypothetical protein PLN69_06560 [bacterium]|nr:hypothetical protein [bacterium]
MIIELIKTKTGWDIVFPVGALKDVGIDEGEWLHLDVTSNGFFI